MGERETVGNMQTHRPAKVGVLGFIAIEVLKVRFETFVVRSVVYLQTIL
jgi:hypothetical protein